MDVNAAGWDRLAADVIGAGTGRRSGLFTILSRPVGAEPPWSTQRLDRLWEMAHAPGSGHRSACRTSIPAGAPPGTHR